MKRAHVVTAVVLSLGIAAACGERDRRDADLGVVETPTQDTQRQQADARPMPITVTGCVTEQENRFVLTQLQPGEAQPGVAAESDPAARPQPTTASYQLVGQEQELRGMVGQRVRVTGEAPPPQVAETREISPSQPTGTVGERDQDAPGARTTPGGQDQPAVGTQQQTRFETTTLRVSSVTEVDGECPGVAQPGQPGQPGGR